MYDMNKMRSMDVLNTAISWKSDRFDIDDRADANGHNEARIEAVCNGSDVFVNDSFDVIAKLVGNTSYRVEVALNSESKIGLWNDGRVVLDYNFATQHWSMDAYVGKHQWLFCEPERVVNAIIAGFKCTGLSQKSSVDAEVIENVIRSIEGDRAYIVANSDLYLNENGKEISDCEYVPENDFYEYVVPAPD